MTSIDDKNGNYSLDISQAELEEAYSFFDKFDEFAETDGVDGISEEEKAAAIAELDLNGDGYLDYNEKMIFARGLTEDFKELADMDGDGTITAEEYSDALTLIALSDKDGNISADTITQAKELQEEMDVNDDGIVDEKDKEFLRNGISKELYEFLLEFADFNNDGEISVDEFQEFKDMLTQLEGMGINPKDLELVLEVADNNGDGKVDANELHEFKILIQLTIMIMAMEGETVTEITPEVLKRAKTIKAEIDDDGSNSISPEEIEKFLKEKLGGTTDKDEQELLQALEDDSDLTIEDIGDALGIFNQENGNAGGNSDSSDSGSGSGNTPQQT
jgi:Ca2+-binding EF-hand superfamily protein